MGIVISKILFLIYMHAGGINILFCSIFGPEKNPHWLTMNSPYRSQATCQVLVSKWARMQQRFDLLRGYYTKKIGYTNSCCMRANKKILKALEAGYPVHSRLSFSGFSSVVPITIHFTCSAVTAIVAPVTIQYPLDHGKNTHHHQWYQ